MVNRAWIKVIVICVFGLIMVGSGNAADMKYSGFLQDYSTLAPGPKNGISKRFIKQGVDFKKYRKIMLDSVVFFLADDAEYKGINAEDMKEISDMFNKAVLDALGPDYPFVADPGPDVLRVRVAITHLKPSNPGTSTVTTVLPVGLALSFVRKGATGEYTGVGSTGMEVEFLDSVTGERIAAGADEYPGGKMSGFSRWNASKEAFEFWVGRLKKFLDNPQGM